LADDTARASVGDHRLSAGDEVSLGEYVPGNVYLAAGRVHLDDRVGGSAFVTGGEVDVTGSVGRNLYAAGGDLRIEGEVEGNVRAAGGKVRVTRGARLRDNVTLAGGSVEVEGEVGEDLQVFGESIVINASVGGDLELAGESIRIGPEARIAGRLEYRSGGSIVVDPQAQVAQGIEEVDADDKNWLRKARRGATRVGGALFTLGVVLLGALLILGLPAFSREAAATIRREWWQSAGIGCVMLIGVPFAIVVLMITVIGIPLALMVIFGYIVLLMLGYVIAALFVGDLALERLGGERIKSLGWRVLFLLLALIALSIVRHVPLIGGLAVALLFVAGIGAFTMRSWKGVRQKDDAVSA
jgi:cytoskeletal protein CcmA (bactofilin family)